jgi:hypothetical protein
MEFDRGFGRLRPDERVAFIADLWSARGSETRRDGRTVVATDPTTGTETRIRLVQVVGSQSSPDILPSNADLLVAGSRSVTEQMNQLDARVLDANDLRSMVLYAIDRERADDLTREYFDRPVSNLIPAEGSTTVNGQDDTQIVAQRSIPDVPRVSPPSRQLELGLVLFAVVALLVGVFIGAATGGVSHDNGSGWTVGGGPPYQDTSTAATRYPPGIGPDGLGNLTQLLRSHRRIVENRPYHLVVRHNGSRGQVVTNARWISSRQTVHVGHDRSHYRVVGTVPPETVGDSPQRLSFVEYRTGPACERETSAALAPNRETPTGCVVLGEKDAAERFAQVVGTYLRRYLDTSTSTAQVVRSGNESRYRITATGNPDRISADVTGYRAVATVNRSGLVTSLRVEYTWQRPDGPRRIRFELQYTEVEDGST